MPPKTQRKKRVDTLQYQDGGFYLFKRKEKEERDRNVPTWAPEEQYAYLIEEFSDRSPVMKSGKGSLYRDQGVLENLLKKPRYENLVRWLRSGARFPILDARSTINDIAFIILQNIVDRRQEALERRARGEEPPVLGEPVVYVANLDDRGPAMMNDPEDEGEPQGGGRRKRRTRQNEIGMDRAIIKLLREMHAKLGVILEKI